MFGSNKQLIHTAYTKPTPPRFPHNPTNSFQKKAHPFNRPVRSMYNLAVHLSSQRQQVARSLSALETGIAGLVNSLAHSAVAANLEAADDRMSIPRACEAYSAIDYRMDDEVGTSVVCLGVLGVTTEILRRAEAVNVIKAEFKAICAPLHGIRIRVPVKDEPSPTRAISAMRVILRNIQRSDLNLLAAYRKIPILDAPPASITYTRANTRSVYRKSVDELYGLLSNAEGPTAAADRARLETLDRRETHFAFVKERYQNVRANVLYARLDPRGRGRMQIAAELPIMYAKGRRAEPPLVQFPAHADLASQMRRIRQPKIEATPFLQSILVYRYVR
jgi:hypothetical protein